MFEARALWYVAFPKKILETSCCHELNNYGYVSNLFVQL